MNKTELIKAVVENVNDGEEMEVSAATVKAVLSAFEDVVVVAVSEGENVTITNFVKFARKDTPAKPRRKGRNPATGEEMMFKAKPASVKVAVTPLKGFKDYVLANKKKGR